MKKTYIYKIKQRKKTVKQRKNASPFFVNYKNLLFHYFCEVTLKVKLKFYFRAFFVNYCSIALFIS